MIFPLKKSNKLWSLFTSFFRIGAFTFGGGYAMIPLIQAETVEKQKWVSDEDILEIVAIAESTPGPIAINAATYIGYKKEKLAGAARLSVVDKLCKLNRVNNNAVLVNAHVTGSDFVDEDNLVVVVAELKLDIPEIKTD